MGIELAPFEGEHVAGAAVLLAERHARHREAEPLLGALEDPAAAVERARRAEGASGAVALADGEVAGYLIGEEREDDVWGRHVWIRAEGHAAGEAEVARDVYAYAARQWVERGGKLQLALVPAVPELADPWFRLSFAHMQAHAVREPGAAAGPPPEGVAIRPGTLDDLEALRPLLPVIWLHQRDSPAFTGYTLPDEQVYLDDWREALEQPQFTSFVAEQEGRIVGHVLLYPEDPDLLRPPGSVYLSVAATLPEARGRGIGVALTDRALEWAREAGHTAVHTDWRVANLESSRFWPARGFRETFWRLARRVEIG
ncbi:MAG TPA: GNAT family N-acetyltransferase [Gaiellaceae bacterium]|nr:GNAT family N-acetyltransferase [Gaiellaceae bacterium]